MSVADLVFSACSFSALRIDWSVNRVALMYLGLLEGPSRCQPNVRLCDALSRPLGALLRDWSMSPLRSSELRI
jgi:hypothetical protein